MSQFIVLVEKEWREHLRNFKIFWIPSIFILFGILEPVTNYFLPQLLNSVGNMPEGTVIQIPEPEPEQILAAVLGQYQFIGLLVLVLAFMGGIAGERRSGTATLLYVRPLSYGAYFMSKWILAGGIALVGTWTGLLSAYYYTALLFAKMDFGNFLQFAGTYSIWILLVVSITLAASAALPNAGMAAAVALGLIFSLQLIDGLLGAYWTISPLKLPMYATAWLEDGPAASDFWWSTSIAVALIVALTVLGTRLAEYNSAKTRV